MIKIENLTKFYGPVKAVDEISFQINDGEILGFLGPNGAGKSTTLKILTSFLTPTNGNIHVDGLNVLEHSMQIRSKIGYLPEQNPLYPEETVYDFLRFAASVRGIRGAEFKTRLREVSELCGLHGVIHRKIAELSKGYRQRTGLAQAIIHDPDILILDEPTTGLDPNQIVEIRNLIKKLGKSKTVIISSHILQEIQATADRMVIINRGKIVADGTIDDLMSSFRGKTRLNLLIKGLKEPADLSVPLENVRVLKSSSVNDAIALSVEYDNIVDPREDIFRLAVKNNWIILEMSPFKVSLEDLFRQLTADEGGEA